MTVTAGDGFDYVYVISVTNHGPSDAQAVSLVDTFPAGFDRGLVAPSSGICDVSDPDDFSCELGTIPAGQTVTVNVHYTVPSTTDSGTQTNSVEVTTTTTETDPTDNQASDTNTVVENVILTTTKEFNSPTVTAGGASQAFTLSITNSGLSDADNVTLTDAVDPRLVVESIAAGDFSCGAPSQSIGCTLAHLGAGQTRSITVTYHVLSTTDSDPSVSNTATGDLAEVSPTSGSDSVAIVESVSLDLVKTFTPATVTAGDGPYAFTVAVTNNGVSDADNLVVSDTVSAALDVSGATATLGGDCTATVGNAVSCSFANLGGRCHCHDHRDLHRPVDDRLPVPSPTPPPVTPTRPIRPRPTPPR